MRRVCTLVCTLSVDERFGGVRIVHGLGYLFLSGSNYKALPAYGILRYLETNTRDTWVQVGIRIVITDRDFPRNMQIEGR